MRAAAKHIVRYQIDQLVLSDIDTLSWCIKKNRQLDPQASLDLSLTQLLPFHQLKNIELASTLLADLIVAQKSICIIGDFDTDGATSTALAVSVLQAFGLKKINYLVPNRFKFGYGLTPEIVEAAQVFTPDAIITVDNGIASLAGVAAANARGIAVIITDHHLPGKELPDAAAIVNPNQPEDVFPSKNLAGVGVIFYLMMAVRVKLRALHWFTTQNIAEPNLAHFLDLVALGTVADVVPLDHNNRILVQQGLLRIRCGHCRPGISALIAFGKRAQSELAASDLSFIVAPRLNAAGRMEDMSLGIECLLAKNAEEAKQYALRLDLLNQERRVVEADMQQDAYLALKQLTVQDKDLPFGLCLFQEHWHQGVTGIIAARLKDRFARPTIAFAKTSEEELKGSGRSVPGLHIRDVLDHIATENPGLVSKFGGHAMAAGVSLPIAHYAQFAESFDRVVRQFLGDKPLHNVICSDGMLSSALLQLDTVSLINSLGPYGQGFPEPIFDGIFELVDQRLVGGRHLKMLLKPQDSQQCIDAIAFNVQEGEWPKYDVRHVTLAYRLDVNEFRNKRTLQLMVEHVQAL